MIVVAAATTSTTTTTTTTTTAAASATYGLTGEPCFSNAQIKNPNFPLPIKCTYS
jgi:hypothetical protein